LDSQEILTPVDLSHFFRARLYAEIREHARELYDGSEMACTAAQSDPVMIGQKMDPGRWYAWRLLNASAEMHLTL
jgi:hypothetical protein